jgi:hypothetical protein
MRRAKTCHTDRRRATLALGDTLSLPPRRALRAGEVSASYADGGVTLLVLMTRDPSVAV